MIKTIDDYEYGTEQMDMGLDFVQTSAGLVCLNEGEIENPFFVGINGSTLSKMQYKDIYSCYNKAYILCMKNKFEDTERLYNFYQQVISEDDLAFMGKQCELIQTSLDIIKVNNYKKYGCVVRAEHLIKMFGNEKFDNTEIIIPLLELRYDTALLNASLYNDQIPMEKLSLTIALTSHYNKSYKQPIIDRFIDHIAGMNEASFWTQERNCHINMTELFTNRSFNYKARDEHIKKSFLANSTEKKNEDVEKILEKLMEVNIGKNFMNYGPPAEEVEPVSNFGADIFTSIKNSKKRTYWMANNDSELKIKKEEVTRLICSLEDEEELFHVFNTFLVSKDYCHMVLNNYEVLTKVQPLFNKFAPLYKVLMGYAWMCFIIEENIMKTKSQKTDRFIFDINTASKLPSFPFTYDDLTQNPYMSIFIDKKIINAQQNATSLQCIEDFDGYGVCNLEQFKWRFNLFASGDPNKDIFEGLDWSKFAISGSVISACLQKTSPLFSIVSNKTDKSETKWSNFFDHYYKDSDIDMMCNTKTILGFTADVEIVIETIKKNIGCTESEINVEPVKSMAVMVTRHFFEEKLDHYNAHIGKEYTLDEMMNDLGSDDMKEYLYKIYYDYKYEVNSKLRKSKVAINPYTKNFLETSGINDMNIHLIDYKTTQKTTVTLDCDKCFFVNDFRQEKVPDDKNFIVLKISENIKYKIRSPKLKKCIELFRSKSEDFFGVVGRFHFPCVRTYYQGDNLYVMPSCISAMMTGINIDYKYFAGVRDPIDIINKYRMRGFGVLLSDNEKKHMLTYNLNVNTFGGMFHIKEGEQLFGAKELTDKIYKPQIYNNNVPVDTYKTPDVKYIKTMEDLVRYYQKKYKYHPQSFGIDLYKFKQISDNGSVNPYQSWLPKAYYNIYKSQANKS